MHRKSVGSGCRRTKALAGPAQQRGNVAAGHPCLCGTRALAYWLRPCSPMPRWQCWPPPQSHSARGRPAQSSSCRETRQRAWREWDSRWGGGCCRSRPAQRCWHSRPRHRPAAATGECQGGAARVGEAPRGRGTAPNTRLQPGSWDTHASARRGEQRPIRTLLLAVSEMSGS